MKRLLLILLLWPMLANAEPLRLEAQGGICEHGLAANGIWHNDAYPEQIDLRSPCWQLSLSQAPWRYGNWSLGWRLAYVELGRYKADTVFPMRDDEAHIGIKGDDCRPETRHGCLGRGRINGRTRGGSIGALAERAVGSFTLGIEGGAYVYYNYFMVTITAYPDESRFDSAKAKWGDIHATPYLGITARYKYLFSTIRGYGHVRAGEHNCSGCSGITHGPAYQATIGIQYEF